MATIKVKAAPGLRFPVERCAGKYITGEAITVTSTAYYRRAIADGDLILVTDAKPAANATGTTQTKDKKAATDE